MQLNSGKELQGGRYRIINVLGQGGFGITYLAEQERPHRKVAIKEFFMKEHCNRDVNSSYVSVGSVGSKRLVERFKQKFLKEADLIASFDNSNVIRIHDVFEENGTAYYVMEYIDGQSLKTYVDENGALAEDLATKYICQIADALAEVHANKLLHLDVKPANIMLNRKGEAVLIDFGISKHYDESGMQTSSAFIGLSEGYAPLEQYETGALDCFTPATDIYSLAATLFFMLTGQRPPKAGDVMNIGLPEMPQNISFATRNAVETAMHPRRKDRPQNIKDFVALLDAKDSTFSDDETIVDSFEDTLILNAGGETQFSEKEILPHFSRQNDNREKEKGEGENDKGERINRGSNKFLWTTLLLLLIMGAAVWLVLNTDNSVQNESAEVTQGEGIHTNESAEAAVDKGIHTTVSTEEPTQEGAVIPILDRKTDKYGFVDKSGNEVITCKYDYANIFSDGLAKVRMNGKCGFIDKNGNEVVPCKYDYIGSLNEGLYVVRVGDEKTGKWGFIDRTGKELVPCMYDWAGDFADGMAIVRVGNRKTRKYGFVDKTGKEVIPCEYERAGSFSEGMAEVERNNKKGFIDKAGNLVVPYKYDWADGFSEGRARVGIDLDWQEYRYGFIDKAGEEVVSCKYDGLDNFREGVACFELNGKCGFIDKNGRVVISPIYENAFSFSGGLAPVQRNGKWGMIDKTGNVVVAFAYNEIIPLFKEGSRIVAKKGKYGLIDVTGNEIIPCKYDWAIPFSEGLSLVRLNGKYGFVDRNGNEVIPCKYDYASSFSGEFTMVELNDKRFYIDKSGKEYIK